MITTSSKIRGIYWFRHDLRISDNQAFSDINNVVDELLCVFIIDPRWFKASHYQSSHMGQHRWNFLQQSLLALEQELASRGQKLLILSGEPIPTLRALFEEVCPSYFAAQQHPGVYERQQWQKLLSLTQDCQLLTSNEHCLFELEQLHFELSELPQHFTPFRKKVESLSYKMPLEAPLSIKPPLQLESSWRNELIRQPTNTSSSFVGGEHVAQKQLNYYLFDSHQVKQYKQTRNDLEGWDNSSKLSPWLANGCLSVRQVMHRLKQFEAEHGENESTYWLYFELLWREYFQWYLQNHGSRLFYFEGVRNKRPLTTFLPQRFKRWCEGETPYPIVNACMKQLNETGYMSNRGRQLVASCLVHELGIDWRFGAAYFEQQLIDFDVASNWGNWQYLAGVGADPRGHRRFDLEKQAQQYDPDSAFTKRWAPQQPNQQLDSFDAADWPIEQ
ncbi:DASH family cryptochrome [Alteromonadaceae bacterium M269]|nr:DASH family cryptochrome [Alteromonadaceae bacterium M269]